MKTIGSKKLLSGALLIMGASVAFIACNTKQENKNGLITIDVTKQYPKQEAVPIQHIAEVEYIPLETNDAFLCDESDGIVYIDTENILFYNQADGNFFLFSGNGKALHVFNRKGQGPEEYRSGYASFFDKESKEIYVGSENRLIVYDLSGNFKRNLTLPIQLLPDLKILKKWMMIAIMLYYSLIN
ncbi:MAG: 6-bladed beta-propeller [Candidatus Symbiothrix sp.]|jgi:hypothetical protein|nr:6-bladed beta-propeller [Candidatus Symbiothrix sp.]